MIVIKVCCQCKENKLKGLNFIFSLLFHRKFDKIAPICALEILCSPSQPIKIKRTNLKNGTKVNGNI